MRERGEYKKTEVSIKEVSVKAKVNSWPKYNTSTRYCIAVTPNIPLYLMRWSDVVVTEKRTKNLAGKPKNWIQPARCIAL